MDTQKTNYGKIAFITTPEFRRNNRDTIIDFIHRDLYWLCNHFEVLTTGRTHDFIMEVLEEKITDDFRLKLQETLDQGRLADDSIEMWKETIISGLTKKLSGVQGMIEIAFELVEERLDAIIHLSDFTDVSGKPDSMVMRREANVHDVPIVSEMNSARAVIRNWKSNIAKSRVNAKLFKSRTPLELSPLDGIESGKKVLGLIAHDRMKLEMCRFFVENAKELFDRFDYFLATGTTGSWLKKFVKAAGRSKAEADRIRCCLSGPDGGDVQIAAAVVKKICHKVVFLQDPYTSHPHETDIRLFEQAVLLFEKAVRSENVDVEFAPNVESAKAILGLSN